MAIKSKNEMEARKAGVQQLDERQEFIGGAENGQLLSKNIRTISGIEVNDLDVKLLSSSALSKLNEWELADKFEKIDGDYHLLKWKIASLIKGKFKSDKLYGQFLQELRDTHPSHPLCTIKTATLRRYYKAAEICDILKIDNLKAVGLSPTMIYELGELKNKDKLNEIYEQIKNENVVSSSKSKKKKKAEILEVLQKNAKVEDVKRLIKLADSIDGEVIESTIDGQSSLVIDAEDHEVLEVDSDDIENDIDHQKTNDEIIDLILNLINEYQISISDKRLILTSVLDRLE